MILFTHKSVKPRTCFVWPVLLMVLLGYVHGAPIPEDEATAMGAEEREKRQIMDNVPSYLMNFGYLPKEDAESGLLMTDDVLKNALMDMQEFAHIPKTGKMDAATKTLMLSPRCGLPDRMDKAARGKRYALQGARWKEGKTLTWSLKGRTGNVEPRRVKRVLHEALDVWQTNSKLTFREVEDDDADILVSFQRREHGDSKGFDGPGMVLAHAYFPGGGIGGDAHFDEDETWRVEEDREGVSLFAVAVHEFGHSLGLLHSDKKEAIMYPWLIQTMHLSRLPDDDRQAIQAIYGANPREPHQGNVDRKPMERPDSPWRVTRPPATTPRARDTTPRARETTPRSRTTTSRYRLPETTRFFDRYTKTTRTPYYDRRKPIVVTQYYPEYPKQTESEYQTPEKCVRDYDAIFMFRGDLYIFKDVYVWRFRDSMIADGFPTKTTQFWDALPKNITRIDAAYENPVGNVVFFVGRLYYTIRITERMTVERSGTLQELGLPGWLDRLDAAMVWPENGKTYLFAGRRYWRYDEGRRAIEPGYPRDIVLGWRGVEEGVDAAVPWTDGKTYFFKEKGYWKYGKEAVVERQQELSAPLLMMCMGSERPGSERWGSEGTHVRPCNYEDNEIC